MKVLRDPQIISGFFSEDPVADIPALTHCGEALCCRGHSLAEHSHPGFEFLYLSRGSANWQSDGRAHSQKMGEIFLAHPHEPHSTGRKTNPENQHIWFGLKLDQLGPSGVRLARRLRRTRQRILPACQEIEPLMRAVVNQVVALRPGRQEVIQRLIQAFIALIDQQLETAETAGREPAPRLLPYSAGIQRAVTYMGSNLDRRLPLADLTAAAMARSVPHFCAQFHREVGVTPAAHHVQLRLIAARETLGRPNFTITEVAHQFGFNSSQHFSTAFKRAFGVTPRAWKIQP